MSRGTNPVGLTIANRDLRRAIFAFTASVFVEWSLWVGVLVYAYEQGGATAAGFTSLGLLVPGIVITPVIGRVADGRRPIRALFVVYLVQSIAAILASIGVFVEAPALVVIGLVTLVVTAIAFVLPASSVVLPTLVRSASELTAANVLTAYARGIGVFGGPLLAAVLLGINGPGLVFAGCGVLAMYAALSTIPLLSLDPPPSISLESHAPTVSLRECLRALARRPGALSLMAALASQYVLIGALDLLYVILAAEVLDMGDSGPGTLSALFGAGAFAGGLLSTLLIGRRRLAPLVILCLVSVTIVMVIFGISTTLVVAVIVLPLAGIARSLLDLAGRMLLQRAAPQDALASVFAVMEALLGIGTALGVVLVQVSLAVWDPEAALIVIGAFFAVLLGITIRGLLRIDASADAPVVAIRHLRHNPIFAHLPGPSLEGVARAAEEIAVPAGHVVIREHDIGDRYYAITGGHVDVTQQGAYIRTMSRGSGFGEIALLADVPRTATVTATDHVTLLAIERTPFLTAVTGHDASARTAWSVAREWHPELTDDRTD